VPPDLAPLVGSWELSLRAERKAPGTIAAYVGGVRQFLAWCDSAGRPAALDRRTVSAYVADLLDQGKEAATATARQLAIRRFSAWLVDEDEIERDDLIGLKAPKIDAKVIQPLTPVQLKALVAACTGLDVFRDRRDEALVRLMAECGLRAGETVAIGVEDVDLREGTVIVRRGKGRTVPIGSQTVRALDRYMRARRTHRLANTPALWLGASGKSFGYEGLHKALARRARMAGIPNFHPHLLRHTAAHRWLAAGGSEGGLMAVAGWSRGAMLDRYTRAQAEKRAGDEARKLNLGDL
jgi:integrase/recombinase XerD